MSKPTRPPTRFGYKSAVILALGFAGFAAWPYLSTAAGRLAQGRPVTVEVVSKEVEKANKAYERKMEKEKTFEPKAVLALADGTTLLGGKQGLMEWRNGQVTPVADFGGMEVRSLVASGDGTLWAAAKDGLWKRAGAEWQHVRKGDFHGVSLSADGALFLTGRMGVFKSRDGRHWEPLAGTETGWKPEHDEEPKAAKEMDKPRKNKA